MTFCSAAGCDIPEDLCDSSQTDRRFCFGCTGEHRLCLKCRITRGVVDGEHGHCASCAATLSPEPPEITRRDSGSERSLEHDDLVTQITRRRRDLIVLGRRDPSSAGPTKYVRRDVAGKPAQLPQLFELLLEHAFRRPNGLYYISAPARTLAVRAELSDEEAAPALDAIIEKEGCRHEGDLLILDAERFGARIAEAKKRVKTHAYGRDNPGRESDSAWEDARYAVKPYAAAAALLIESATIDDGAPSVRDASALLRRRLGISIHVARGILMRFIANGSIAKKDDFSVITINADALRDEKDEEPKARCTALAERPHNGKPASASFGQKLNGTGRRQARTHATSTGKPAFPLNEDGTALIDGEAYGSRKALVRLYGRSATSIRKSNDHAIRVRFARPPDGRKGCRVYCISDMERAGAALRTTNVRKARTVSAPIIEQTLLLNEEGIAQLDGEAYGSRNVLVRLFGRNEKCIRGSGTESIRTRFARTPDGRKGRTVYCISDMERAGAALPTAKRRGHPRTINGQTREQLPCLNEQGIVQLDGMAYGSPDALARIFGRDEARIRQSDEQAVRKRFVRTREGKRCAAYCIGDMDRAAAVFKRRFKYTQFHNGREWVSPQFFFNRFGLSDTLERYERVERSGFPDILRMYRGEPRHLYLYADLSGLFANDLHPQVTSELSASLEQAGQQASGPADMQTSGPADQRASGVDDLPKRDVEQHPAPPQTKPNGRSRTGIESRSPAERPARTAASSGRTLKPEKTAVRQKFGAIASSIARLRNALK